MGSPHSLQLRRAYLPATEHDGYRILIDRLWPRGLSRQKACLDAWDKDIAPSALERKQFHTGQESYDSFACHYLSWLDQSEEAAAFVQKMKNLLRQDNVTLVYSAKDTEHNNAQVLYAWLQKRLQASSPAQSA